MFRFTFRALAPRTFAETHTAATTRVLAAVSLALLLVGCGGELGEPLLEAIPAPTGLSSTVLPGRVDLAWVDDSDQEDSFRIQRGTSGADFALLATVGADVTTYSDTAVAEDTPYTYRVAACNAEGCSAFSEEARASTAPSPPSGLAAAIQPDSTIALSWADNSATETEFRIQRSAGAGAYATVATTPANETAHPDGDVLPDTEYSYRVLACHPQACSVPSGEASILTVPAPPAADSATAVTNTRIDVRWTDRSATESAFHIERRTASEAFAEVGTTGPDVALYVDEGLDPGTTYEYRIRACNSGGCSAYSDTLDSTTGTPPPPLAPSALTATLSGDGASVIVGWMDNSEDESSFQLWRSVNAGTFAERAAVGADTTTFVDTDLNEDTPYTYRVAACNAEGCSAFSEEASVVTRPLAPSGLTATIGAGRIDLSWADNSDTEAEFEVERSVGGGAFTTLTTVPPETLGYSDTDVTDDTRYTYRIRACNVAGCSPYSGTAATVTRPLPATELLAQPVSESGIALAWTDQSSTELEFQVERRRGATAFAWVGSTSTDATSFTDEGLASGTTYDYRVAACNTAGCAAPSNEASATTNSGPQALFPLRVSNDQRWLEHADGSSFQLNGEAAWAIMSDLRQSDVEVYLSDRAAKGVNLIIASLINHRWGATAPTNAHGDAPFTDTLPGGEEDFTTPNESYWSHVDWVLDRAAAYGIAVLAFPAYLGYQHNEEGWSVELIANGTVGSETYGYFLGSRYANQPNLLWGMAGDWGPTYADSDVTDEFDALASGISSGGSTHPMTAKGAPGTTSRTGGWNRWWLAIDAVYPDFDEPEDIAADLRVARQDAPVIPVFMIERNYGNEHDTDPLTLRTQMWHSVLGGGFGHVYGQAPIWYFGEDASHPANSFADLGGLDWHSQLDTYGSPQLQYVAELQAVRSLEALTPDYSHIAATSGYGPEGLGYAPVMYGTQQLVAYIPDGDALTVDKSQFTPGTYTVTWFNPRDGTSVAGGTSSFGNGLEVFTPPDSNDWVLLLDDQSLGLGQP
jgi:fibronectin type 3 domain-containing protein